MSIRYNEICLNSCAHDLITPIHLTHKKDKQLMYLMRL